MNMEIPERFCVRWNSYKSNLQTAFPKLLTSEHFVDVTLACEKQFIKCHKIVLSACSVYFENLLVNNPCQHPIIFMKDVEFWEIQALVEFMYKGEVNILQNQLDSLLKFAESLQIRGLSGTKEFVNLDQSESIREVSLSDNKTKRHKSDNKDDEDFGKKRKKKNEEEEKCIQITSVRGADEIFNDIKVENIDENMSQAVIKTEVIDLEDCNYGNPYMDSDRQDKPDTGSYSQDLYYQNHSNDPGPSGLSELTPSVHGDEMQIGNEKEKNSRRRCVRVSKPETECSRRRRTRVSKPETEYTRRRALTGRSSYKQYSLESMWAALEEIGNGVSVYRASMNFGVPRKTLRNWMKKYNIMSHFGLMKKQTDKQKDDL